VTKADVPTITLDTVCASALATPSVTNDPDEVAALEELVARSKVGRVRLQVTAAYYHDVERDHNETRGHQRREWWESLPDLGIVPGVFRLNSSRLDDPLAVLGADTTPELDGRLREIQEPVRRSQPNVDKHEDNPAVLAYLFSDVDHLIAHEMSGANWFATMDNGILKRTDELVELGIEVARPSTILTLLS
jgi:hypothetical protein